MLLLRPFYFHTLLSRTFSAVLIQTFGLCAKFRRCKGESLSPHCSARLGPRAHAPPAEGARSRACVRVRTGVYCQTFMHGRKFARHRGHGACILARVAKLSAWSGRYTWPARAAAATKRYQHAARAQSLLRRHNSMAWASRGLAACDRNGARWLQRFAPGGGVGDDDSPAQARPGQYDPGA